MKDFLGQTIHVGDFLVVATSYNSSAGIYTGIIERIIGIPKIETWRNARTLEDEQLNPSRMAFVVTHQVKLRRTRDNRIQSLDDDAIARRAVKCNKPENYQEQ